MDDDWGTLILGNPLIWDHKGLTTGAGFTSSVSLPEILKPTSHGKDVEK
jgi:hypothetical protein